MDITVRIQTLSMADAGCPDVVVEAAAGGDLDTLSKYLSHYPEHVRPTTHCGVCVHVHVWSSH